MTNTNKAIIAGAASGLVMAILSDESNRKTITKFAEAAMNSVPDTITINTKPVKNLIKNKVEQATGDSINLVQDADVMESVNPA